MPPSSRMPENLSKLVVDMETGQRGFCITKEEEFLVPYTVGAKAFETLLAREEQLVSESPGQVEALVRIRSLVHEWQEKAARPAAAEVDAALRGDDSAAA